MPLVRRLILFDIDGTLLHSHGAGRRAMEAALLTVFGATGPTHYRYDGKTDRQIVRELMRAEGHDDARIDEQMPSILDAYLIALQRELASPAARVHPMAGVMELLEALVSQAHCVVGLLTGNLEHGARHKLEAASIGFERFLVGAYGSDHEDRGELPAIAQQRARERLGADFHGGQMVIIGDTPSDVLCGRRIGARAIGVATGQYTVADLTALEPAFVFQDLTDTAAVLAAIDE